MAAADGREALWGFCDRHEVAEASEASSMLRRGSGEYGFGTLGPAPVGGGISRGGRQGTKYHGFGNRKALEVIPDGLVNFLNGGHSTTIIEVQEVDKNNPSPRASVDVRRRRSSLYGFDSEPPRGSEVRSPHASVSVPRAA